MNNNKKKPEEELTISEFLEKENWDEVVSHYLEALGIKFVKDLAQTSIEELRTYEQFSDDLIDEINDYLKKHGLSLSESCPNNKKKRAHEQHSANVKRLRQIDIRNWVREKRRGNWSNIVDKTKYFIARKEAEACGIKLANVYALASEIESICKDHDRMTRDLACLSIVRRPLDRFIQTDYTEDAEAALEILVEVFQCEHIRELGLQTDVANLEDWQKANAFHFLRLSIESALRRLLIDDESTPLNE